MKKQMLYIVLAALCLFLRVSAQDIKPLKIGDKIPNEIWNLPLLVINHPEGKKNITLGEYHNKKLIILDFWATWCGACIAAIPRIHKLQEQFTKDVVVIPVAYEENNKVSQFVKENKTIGLLNTPSIIEDRFLKKLFPHRLLPHYVWIYDGKVKLITASKDVNFTSIKDLLDESNSSVDIKTDALDFDKHLPLLENKSSVTKEKQLYQSLLTRHLPGVGASEGITKDSVSKRYYFINRPIMALYDSAVNFLFGNRIILNVSNMDKFIRVKTPWGNWEKENTYCYELTVPLKTTKEEVKKIMLEDLNRYFGLNAQIEKRLVDCQALISYRKNNSIGQDEDKKNSEATNISDLNYQIQSSPLRPIIIDESNYKGSLSIKDYNGDISKLRHQLKVYSLDLIPVQRVLSVLVITQN